MTRNALEEAAQQSRQWRIEQKAKEEKGSTESKIEETLDMIFFLLVMILAFGVFH